jgi:hypothetical protein
MIYRTILISLLVFALLALPAAPAFARQAPSSKWGDCVAVLPGQRDDVGGVLTAMNIPYRSITPAEVKDDAFLGKLCALFIASGSAAGSDAAPHVARWVEQGGSLYVSGSALDVILAAFPGRLSSGGKALPGSVRVELADKGAAAAMGTEITLTVPNGGWSLLGQTDALVHARGHLDSGDAPLVVSFSAGQGRVVYSALNAGMDLSDAQQKLVRFFVIRTLYAKDVSQALRRFPVASAAPLEIADTVDPGRFSTEFAFTVRQADDWDVVLLWNEGLRGLTLRGPDGIENTRQSDAAPFVVPIRNAAPGVWKVYTRGLIVPSANSPFLLVLVPRRGTNLLNGIPTPLQASRDATVLLGNLGLAVAMAVLFALGAWLFKDTLAERKESRALAAVGGAAARVGGAVGALFAPATWKLPPPVRRLAVALELAVFLALTALVASFLDPHFTPSNARGVGIFAGMLVAFAVVTLVYALAQSATARAFGVTGVFQIRPGYLLVVAACVLVSRLLDFVPGYVFGLAAGFAVLGALEGARRRDGMLALVAILAPLAVGLISWALSIPTDLALRNVAQGQVNATVSGGLTTVLGAVQSALLLVSLVALWQTFFELFPIAGLRGWTLFTRSPVVWFVLMVAAALLTVHLLVNPSATVLEMPENRALVLLVVVLAIYSAAAVGAWLLFNAPRLRGVGTSPRRSAVIIVILTILVWLCTCGSGAALVALRYLGPR